MAWVITFAFLIFISQKYLLVYANAKEFGQLSKNSSVMRNISTAFNMASNSANNFSCQLDNCNQKLKLEWYEFYISPDDGNLIYTTMQDMSFPLQDYTLCGSEGVICADILQNKSKYIITCNFMSLTKDEYEILSNNSLQIIPRNETLPIPIYLELQNPIGAVNVCYPLSHALKECPFKLTIRRNMYRILPNKSLYHIPKDQYFEPAEYGMWDNDCYTHDKDLAFTCAPFQDPPPNTVDEDLAAQILKILSVVSLITVVSVHIIFPSINYHSKPLLCHVICVVMIEVVQILQSHAFGVLNIIPMKGCYWFAGLQYYFTLCAFFWVNVIAFDIWRSFSKINTPSGTGINCCPVQCLAQKPLWCKIKRSFPIYCLYAWGIPTVMLACLVVFHNIHFSPTLSPVFSVEMYCWFKSVATGTVFMYGPLAIITLENLIFFSLTVYNLYKITQESKLVNKKPMKMLVLVSIKLFTLMSLAWIIQELKWTLHPGSEFSVVWFIMDLFVASQGIFVFIIYMCKSSTYNVIFNKFKSSNDNNKLSRLRAKRPNSTLITMVPTNSNKSMLLNSSQDGKQEELHVTDN